MIQPAGLIPLPLWCKRTAMITRTEGCVVFSIIYTTQQIVDGVPEPTGEANLDAFSYTYSSPNLPVVAHQISANAWSGWGDALKASITGTAQAAKACQLTNAAFPPQPLLPLKTNRSGEAYAKTTATKSGAVGRCQTSWTLSFTNPGYTTAGIEPTSWDVMRCDNATGANGFRKSRIGCVVPEYLSKMMFSRSRTPQLASHISRAQKSGLPGAAARAPLTRTTSMSIQKKNRSLACGKAPKVKKYSCDEYPMASTRQGLAAGGKLRTFKGCRIKAPTTGKGARGASACMILASQNNSQGATMAAFFYDWRVLNGDRFLVGIGR